MLLSREQFNLLIQQDPAVINSFDESHFYNQYGALRLALVRKYFGFERVVVGSYIDKKGFLHAKSRNQEKSTGQGSGDRSRRVNPVYTAGSAAYAVLIHQIQAADQRESGSHYQRRHKHRDQGIKHPDRYHADKGIIEIGYNKFRKGDDMLIMFYVKDTGIGIAKEDIDVIFERFVQSDNRLFKEGAGLGLSISKGIIKILGGKIWK